MNVRTKKISLIVLTCLCVWFFVQLVSCKIKTTKFPELYGFPVSSDRTSTPGVEPAAANDSIEDQPEDLAPLSVEYNGPPIHSMYEGGFEIDNPKVCGEGGSSAPELLIVVHSAASQLDMRTAVRYTWKHFDRMENVAVVFFLGRSLNGSLSERVRAESDFFGDVVVSNVVDAYENLTLKTISMCEWARRSCPRARFVLKADDDVFLNVPLLVDFVRQKEVSSASRSVYGMVNRGTGPVRYPGHKFDVPVEVYPGDVYPDYMQGASYLLTGDLVGPLFRAALRMDFFRMEDVFLTGFAAERIRARKVDVARFYTLFYEMWEERTFFEHTLRVVDPCDVKRRIAIHYVSYSDIFKLWYYLFDKTKSCR
ncbi:beta-1,3-galactosyltransferase 5-like [Bacillus rossius redtenbacheri]|uniref:beta-1,3-galactosyltransferase 5-like n=1 Tax=Bacillus rossius redtenbacheri TaxID=93214 RepID=UPI002FDD0B65